MKKIFIILFTSITFISYGQFRISAGLTPKQKNPAGWIRVYREELVGIIDGSGVEILPAIYDEIKEFGTHKIDWALIRKGGLYGFIDEEGNVVVPPAYEEIHIFGEYCKDWALVKKDGLYGFIDEYGIEIVKPAYDQIEGTGKSTKLTD